MKRTPGGRPALYATRDFDVLPVSIGRDAACTICLEDPHKHMSRFHVEIQEEGGTYWMAVVSKVNPVMAEGRRYGPGTRLTLHSGDSFELAEYEVQVMLPEPVPAGEKPAAKAPPPSADALIQEPTSTQIHGTPPLDACRAAIQRIDLLRRRRARATEDDSVQRGDCAAGVDLHPAEACRAGAGAGAAAECPMRCGWCSKAPVCRTSSCRPPRASGCCATAARSCARPSRES